MKKMPTTIHIFVLLLVAETFAMSKEAFYRNISPNYRMTFSTYEKKMAILKKDTIEIYTISSLKSACLSVSRSKLVLNDSGAMLNGWKFSSPEYVNYTLNHCLIDSVHFSLASKDNQSTDSLLQVINKFVRNQERTGQMLDDPPRFRRRFLDTLAPIGSLE